MRSCHVVPCIVHELCVTGLVATTVTTTVVTRSPSLKTVGVSDEIERVKAFDRVWKDGYGTSTEGGEETSSWSRGERGSTERFCVIVCLRDRDSRLSSPAVTQVDRTRVRT